MKSFLYSLTIADSFTGYISLGWPSWSFRNWNALFQVFLAFKVSTFSFICDLCFLFYVFNILTVIGMWAFLLVLSIWCLCSSCICLSMSFLSLGKFFNLVEDLIYSSNFWFFSSPMPIIWRFIYFLSWCPHRFLSCALKVSNVHYLCCLILLNLEVLVFFLFLNTFYL